MFCFFRDLKRRHIDVRTQPRQNTQVYTIFACIGSQVLKSNRNEHKHRRDNWNGRDQKRGALDRRKRVFGTGFCSVAVTKRHLFNLRERTVCVQRYRHTHDTRLIFDFNQKAHLLHLRPFWRGLVARDRGVFVLYIHRRTLYQCATRRRHHAWREVAPLCRHWHRRLCHGRVRYILSFGNGEGKRRC